MLSGLYALESSRRQAAEFAAEFQMLEDQLKRLDLARFEDAAAVSKDEAAAAARVADEAQAQGTIEGIAERIVLAIRNEDRPHVQMLLIMILVKLGDWIMSALISVVVTGLTTTATGEKPPSTKKEVLVAAHAAGGVGVLQDYRFVSAKQLFVRQNPRAQSPVIGTLAFGRPVKLIKKEKGFALVEWRDAEGEAVIQGWVFARYLSKFR